jgi:hypothetical protein
MFGAIVKVLRSIPNDYKISVYTRGDASNALKMFLSFDWVYSTLHERDHNDYGCFVQAL